MVNSGENVNPSYRDMIRSIFLILASLIFVKSYTYRAAIVDYSSWFRPEASPIDVLRKNAFAYSAYASLAAEQGVDIIAFPEYGLTSTRITNGTRDTVLPYLQSVSNLENVSWIPCLEQNPPTDIQILHLLSCAARSNSIVLVANLLTKESCDKLIDPSCPSDGRYQFNTNVIFDRNGTVAALYNKQRLFTEEIFLNYPPRPRFGIVDVGFAKIGTVTCFDTDFYDPTVRLIRLKGVKHLIILSAWFSELPFTLAPQWYSAWAEGLGVNVIGANYRHPIVGGLGSGIYTPGGGAVKEIFDLSSTERLIVADLPVNPRPVPNANSLRRITSDNRRDFTNDIRRMQNSSTSYTPFVITDRPSSKPTSLRHKVYYQNLVNFSFAYLPNSRGSISVSHGRIYCRVKYSLRYNSDAEIYALLVYDGVRSFSKFEWGIQECTLAKCETKGDLNSCARITNQVPSTRFESLSLSGTFATDAVLPSVLRPNLRNLPRSLWDFTHDVDTTDQSRAEITIVRLKEPVIAVNLYGINKN